MVAPEDTMHARFASTSPKGKGGGGREPFGPSDYHGDQDVRGSKEKDGASSGGSPQRGSESTGVPLRPQ